MQIISDVFLLHVNQSVHTTGPCFAAQLSEPASHSAAAVRHAKHGVTVRDKKLSDPMLYYCLHPAPPDTPLQLRLLTISKRLNNQILRIFSVPLSVLRQYGCACAPVL